MREPEMKIAHDEVAKNTIFVIVVPDEWVLATGVHYNRKMRELYDWAVMAGGEGLPPEPEHKGNITPKRRH
jgi:hypothetical protein